MCFHYIRATSPHLPSVSGAVSVVDHQQNELAKVLGVIKLSTSTVSRPQSILSSNYCLHIL